MNPCLDFIQIWYGSLGISDDLINFCDESIKNRQIDILLTERKAFQTYLS